MRYFKGMRKNTERLYIYWWDMWTDWCTENGFVPKPARPAGIVKFVNYLVDEKEYAKSSVRLAVSVISKVHGEEDESPMDSEEVKEVMLLVSRRGAATRRPGWAQKIEEDTVERLGGQITMLKEAGSRNVRRALVDMALAYLVFEEGLHFTEIAELVWGDFNADEGKLIVSVSSSWERTALTLLEGTVTALAELRDDTSVGNIPIFISTHSKRGGEKGSFSMTSTQLSRRVAQIAVKSGFEPNRAIVR